MYDYINVLEHIADNAGVARETARVPRPGGRVLCMVPENQALYSRTDAANGHLRRFHKDELLRIFAPSSAETLFDYGFPFTRMYLNVLGRVHDAVVPHERPTGLKRAGIRAASAALTGLFSLNLLFAGWFRGVEILAVFRKPGA
jgi:hypothetical protein